MRLQNCFLDGMLPSPRSASCRLAVLCRSVGQFLEFNLNTFSDMRATAYFPAPSHLQH